MNAPCPGCNADLDINPTQNALSRYDHGSICPGCGIIEAMYADFITRYSQKTDADLGIYPIDQLLANNITA